MTKRQAQLIDAEISRHISLALVALVGLLKGGLLTVVLVWLAQVAGLIPTPPDTPVVSLFTVDRLWELLLSTLPA